MNAVYDYAKQMKSGEGLVIMDTPGNDPSSVAAMIAGGCQLVLFSTGRGTPTGNPVGPVIKLTANKATYEKMKDNIDVDASTLLESSEKLNEMADDLLQEICEIASGKATKSESLGFMEMAIARVCNYV
ncbi:Altronate dehydratase [bioreactor metagenome]|uniref:Altronate dehydratase n=1 Tax=bioreactor metagenome TaxID=1076179 RepID=A0A645C0L5_9ZZZZ